MENLEVEIIRYAMYEDSLIVESIDIIGAQVDVYHNIDIYFRDIIRLEKRHYSYAYAVAYNNTIRGVLQLSAGIKDNIVVDTKIVEQFSKNLSSRNIIVVCFEPGGLLEKNDNDSKLFDTLYESLITSGIKLEVMRICEDGYILVYEDKHI